MKLARTGVTGWLITTGALSAFIVAGIILVILIAITERKAIVDFLLGEEH